MDVLKKFATLKTQFLMFCAAMLVLLPLRSYQVLRLVDVRTGFYKEKDFSVVLLYVLLALLLLCFFLLSLLRKKELHYSYKLKKYPVLALFCALVAVSMIWDIYASFSHITENMKQIERSTGLFRMLIKTGILPKAGEVLCAAGACLFFCLLCKSYVTGRSNGSNYKLLALFPIAWTACRMVYRFTRTISFLNVSDLFLELLMLVFLLLFLMAFAQLNSRVNSGGLDWKLSGYGFFAAVCCLVCVIPRLMLLVTGNEELIGSEHLPEPCDLAFALFIVGTIFSRVSLGVTQKEIIQE